MFKRRTPTKICQRRPGRKSRERSELSGHVGKGRELVGIGREMSVSVMGGLIEELDYGIKEMEVY